MMRNKKLQELDLSLNSLIVFRHILTDPVIVPLRPLLDIETTDPIIQLRQYAEFTSRLFPQNMNLTEYLLGLVLHDDNFFVRMLAKGDKPDDILYACVRNELGIIERLAHLKPVELMKEISYYGPLPEWKISDIDFAETYFTRLDELTKFGYGHYAQSTVFTVEHGRTIPAQHPDPVRLSQLFGYEEERGAVIRNTIALLEGKPAQNVLLCGDTGTGKSSTVKAIVNEYAGDGLRLIQITKEQLRGLPAVWDSIYGNPLKFILFIDDLSFHPGDGSFSELKAILEGSVTAMPSNAVIYATSNLTQLVPMPGRGEIIGDDEVQERISLAARFGLRVQFKAPEKEEYLNIVQAIADLSELPLDTDTLCEEAEKFAVRAGGRSPRAAKQAVQQAMAEIADA